MILWFVTMALVPMIVVALAGYFLASDSLKKMATNELIQTSRDLSTAISNWFDYRVMDVNNQAVQLQNVQLLEGLRAGFERSGKPLGQYAGSEQWSSPRDTITICRSDAFGLMKRS